MFLQTDITNGNCRLPGDFKYVVIVPDGTGSKGDEAMISGCLNILQGDNVLVLTQRPAIWNDVLAGRNHLFTEMYVPLEKMHELLNIKTNLIVLGADTLDGSCGYEAGHWRYEAMKNVIANEGKVWAFCSVRSDIPQELLQELKYLPKSIDFFVRDEISAKNFEAQLGFAPRSFPDLAFYALPLNTSRIKEMRTRIEHLSRKSTVIGLELSETMFRSFNTQIDDEHRKAFAVHLADMMINAQPNAFFVLLSHDTRSWSEQWSDWQYAKAVYEHMISHGLLGRVLMQPPSIMQVELLTLLDVCDVVVCGRMHMSITCYRAGVLPIVVAGQGKNYVMIDKVRGMCLNRFGSDIFLIEKLEEIPQNVEKVLDDNINLRAKLAEKNNLEMLHEKKACDALRQELGTVPTAAVEYSSDVLNIIINVSERACLLQDEKQALSVDYNDVKARFNDVKARFKEYYDGASVNIENLQAELGSCKVSMDNTKAQLNDCQIELNSAKSEMFNQNNRINELESWADIYRRQIAELEAIRQSRTWRYAHKLTSIGARLCPAGTLRRKAVLAVFGAPIRAEHALRRAWACHRQRVQLQNEPVIILPQYEAPLVSIIIPVYNQYAYTHACVKSILETCGDIAFEIILADDNSTDFTKKISEKIKNLVIVRNKENMRFLFNCNNAAKVARGEFIVFLNNDTIVRENWLQSMIDLMRRRADCGMAGSKIVFPDGRLQEAGGILWQDATAWNYGRMQSPDASEYNYVKEVDYISGCSIMIRHSLWNEIGGFDTRFAPAYCEDSDLAFEVRRHGFKVLYQPLSTVVHYEGITNGVDVQNGQKQYQIVNNAKLREKWKTVLINEHFPQGKNVFCARDKSAKKPCVLFIDHYVPTFDQDAGSRTVYEYLRLFVKMGYNVKFIPDNFNKSEKYTEALQQLGIEVLYGYEYSQNWKAWIQSNADKINFVFTNRPHISVKYIDFIRQATNARIIYYGHDLHFLRQSREYELTHDESLLPVIEKHKAIELSLMRKADMSYYPSKIEEDYIHAIDANIRVKALPAYIFDDVKTPIYDIKSRKNILFVGGFAHTPNVDAVLWFVREIMPQVLKAHNIHFDIVGSHPTDEVKALQNDNITVHGFVQDEVLAQFYAKSRLTVVPLRFGAGIKGKVVEAMKFGIPVLTTAVGAEGIEGAEAILAIEDEPKAFAQRLVALYDDGDALKAMSCASCEYVRNYFGPENAMNTIREDFT